MQNQKIRKNKLSIKKNALPQKQLTKEDIIKKQIEEIKLLFTDQDYTIDQFFQKLNKSSYKQDIIDALSKVQLQKFLSKNYAFFIQTQQQITQIQVPKIQMIQQTIVPELPQLIYKEKKEQIQLNSVISMLDSFNNYLFQRDYKQALKVLQTIKQMKQNQRYQKFFYKKQIQQLTRQYYNQFIDSCKQEDILLQANEIIKSVKVYFSNKTQKIMNEISGNLAIGSFDILILGNMVKKLIQQILVIINQFKNKYTKYQDRYPIYIYSSKWIENVTQEFYQLISPYIYQNQQLIDILSLLNKLFIGAAELQSKGISLVRIFKKFTIVDLTYHIQRFIEVIMDSFNDILKTQIQLYQMTNIQHIKSISQQLTLLKPVREDEYEKICCSKKVILLINAYTLLLEPIFDKKWQFLHQKILTMLVNKTQQIFANYAFCIWDYYNLFRFFEELKKGRLRKRAYNNFNQEYKTIFKIQYNKISEFAKNTWDKFQNLANQFYFNKILSLLPKLFWDNGKIYSSKQKRQMKPSPFSLQLTKIFTQFAKNFQFRLTQNEFQLIGLQFFQYLIYVIQYIVYVNYHNNGQNLGIFILPQKFKNLYEKAKNFKIKELPQFQESEKKIFKLSYFSNFGMQIFVLDMHFITIILNKIFQSQKISADTFLGRIVKIQEKQKKVAAVEHRFECYLQYLTKSPTKESQTIKKLTLKRLNTAFK